MNKNVHDDGKLEYNLAQHVYWTGYDNGTEDALEQVAKILGAIAVASVLAAWALTM